MESDRSGLAARGVHFSSSARSYPRRKRRRKDTGRKGGKEEIQREKRPISTPPLSFSLSSLLPCITAWWALPGLHRIDAAAAADPTQWINIIHILAEDLGFRTARNWMLCWFVRAYATIPSLWIRTLTRCPANAKTLKTRRRGRFGDYCSCSANSAEEDSGILSSLQSECNPVLFIVRFPTWVLTKKKIIPRAP